MKKFFAGLFVFIILVIYPITLLTTVIRYAVFKPTVVKHIVRSSQIAEHLPAVIAETTGKDTGLSTGQTEELIENALKPEDVYAITDQVVDVVSIWLGTDEPIEKLDIRISTGNIKSQLFDSSQGETDLSFLPDELTTNDLLSKSGGVEPSQLKEWNAQLNQARHAVRQTFWFIWLGWGIILIGLLAIALLRYKPLYSLFGWYGWTLLLMTIECIPLALLLWLAPGWLLPWISGNTSATVIEIVDRALAAMIRVLLLPVGIVMGSTLCVSIIFLIIRSVLKRRER